MRGLRKQEKAASRIASEFEKDEENEGTIGKKLFTESKEDLAKVQKDIAYLKPSKSNVENYKQSIQKATGLPDIITKPETQEDLNIEKGYLEQANEDNARREAAMNKVTNKIIAKQNQGESYRELVSAVKEKKETK